MAHRKPGVILKTGGPTKGVRDMREHIDLDDTDLRNTLVDIWPREGFRRVQEYAHNWTHLIAAETIESDGPSVNIQHWRNIQDVRIDRWSLSEIPDSVARRCSRR